MPFDNGLGNFEMDATGWLLPRETTNAFVRSNRTTFFQSATNTTSTQMLINEFRFAAAKSIRTSTIILATFNTIAAFATVLGILWDNYSREKRSRGYSIRRDGLNFVQAPEVYPLFLSMGIMIQGIIFAAAQGTGLDSLFTTGCALIAQTMLPALFLVTAIQVIFGLETMIRALRSKPFPKRHPWTVRLCLILVVLSFIVGFLVAYVSRTPDFCFASLFWFVSHYSMGCFVTLLISSVLLTISTVTIFVKLSRTPDVEATQRVTASQMVYYLTLAIISNVLLLPFFFHMAFYDQRDPRFQGLTLSVVASVVSEVSGLLTGCLYLLLRSNTVSSIGPKNKFGDDKRQQMKDHIRVWSPVERSDDGFSSGITSPNELRRMDSQASMLSRYEKDIEASMDEKSPANPLGSNAVYPQPPEPVHQAYPTRPTTRTKSIYSIITSFRPLSTAKSNPPPTLLPATTYSPTSASNSPTSASNSNSTAVKPHRFDFSTLKPPPSMNNLSVGRHRRDSSIASHITVQLGLRLSNVANMPPMEPRQSCESTMIPVMDQTRLPPQSKPMPKPSPLQKAVYVPPNMVEDDDDVDSDTLSLDDAAVTYPPVKQEEMLKVLPPSPRPPMPKPITTIQRASSEKKLGGETLSPTVYSPHSPQSGQASPSATKLPSPKGVGFAAPISRYNSTTQRNNSTAQQRSNSTASRSDSTASRSNSTASRSNSTNQRSPPRKASTASVNARQPPPGSDKSGDWI